MSDRVEEQTVIRLSVRRLVEFLRRSGDIDNRRRAKEKDAMQEGSRIHRKIQKSMGRAYVAEVPLSGVYSLDVYLAENSAEFSAEFSAENEKAPGTGIVLMLEGRADGIADSAAQCSLSEEEVYYYTPEYGPMELHSQVQSHWRLLSAGEPQSGPLFCSQREEMRDCPLIDEIKGVSRPVHQISEPLAVHLAQALCYADLYCRKKSAAGAWVQITYCNLEQEEIRRFRRFFAGEQLRREMDDLLREYTKWAVYTVYHSRKRDASIRNLQFPFPYRPGQKKLAACVYQTIRHKRSLFLQAPTGIGKTLSVMFPAVKAMGMGMGEKIFYLTAKTTARIAAEESIALMRRNGLFFSSVSITAKEKWCVLEKMSCNPFACPRAKGHFDRVNRAVYAFLTGESEGSRERILAYADEYQVCPFEYCLDLTNWSDAVICDYNYVFDPNVCLQRYFLEGSAGEYLFLVDEAHNLVERAREMYSAVLVKEDVLQAAKIAWNDRTIKKWINRLNRCMLSLKRRCEGYVVYPDGEGLEELADTANRVYAAIQDFWERNPQAELPEQATEFFFQIRDFVTVWDGMDDCYKAYSEILEDERFMVRLFCVDPSRNVQKYRSRGRAAVFFSATFLPMPYYRKLLGGTEEDYAVYVDSPFPETNRILCISRDTTSRYTRRGEQMYRKIAATIVRAVRAKSGNYMVFFPSYRFLEEVARAMREEGFAGRILLQESKMSEEGREQFLGCFLKRKLGGTEEESLVGCCVMGGSFSEGVDLKNERLIGVFVVGTGIPLVCTERKILQEHFDAECKKGYEFSYLYPGINKVLQAAGRLIRTPEDVGVIALLDDRFLQPEYMQLFPREWKQYCPVTKETIFREVGQFWAGLDINRP